MDKSFKRVVFYRYSLLNRGGDRVVVDYANYLVSLGYEVVFVVSEIITSFKIDNRIKIDYFKYKNPFMFLFNGMIFKCSNSIVVFDIIHHSLFLMMRNKCIYLAQADDVEYYKNKFLRWVVDKIYFLYFKRGGITISDHEGLTESFKGRYAASGIHTVSIGINHDVFYPQVDRNLLSEKEDRMVLFFMNRGDVYRKGIDIGIRVLRGLAKSKLSSSLEVWTCGIGLSEEDLGLKVRNFGRVSDCRLRQILSSSDVFLYPSRHEGFGLFPLEAMACGCVVVTTDAVPYSRAFSCIQTVDVEDVDGLIMKIETLVITEEGRKKYSKQSIEVSAGFDMDQAKTRFVDAINAVSE